MDHGNTVQEFMTLEEAASYLRRPKLTVEKWARAGIIPGFKTGKRWLFRVEELRRWVESHRAGQNPSKSQIERAGA